MAIAVVAVALILGRDAFAEQYANPLDVRLADPQVLLDNGTYYLYHTGTSSGFKVWTSSDLVNWRYRGLAYTRTSSSWGKTSLWAPEVVKYGSLYYMVYSAAGGADGYKRICIARATSPLGPFTDIAAPLFDDGQGWIDGHIFFDDDGQIYLYCTQALSDPPDTKSYTHVAKLNNTFTAITTGLTLCLSPSGGWEAGATNMWNEGAAVVKHSGYYYLLYSGNAYSSSNYAIGYATATSPLGPWTKFAGNPIVKKTATVSGPGHCAVVKSPDLSEQWLVYHTHQQLSGGGDRQLAIDKIVFVDQPTGPDLLTVPGAPSSTMKTAPSGIPAFPAGETDEFNSTALARGRWTLFNESGSNFSLPGTTLDIKTADGDTYQDVSADQENIFLQYPPWPDFEMQTKVNFSPAQNYEQAALYVWQDHNNYIRFSDAWISERRLEVGVETGAVFSSVQEPTTIGANCWLKVRKVGNQYTFWASGDGTTFKQIGAVRTVNLIDIRVGLGATASGSGRAVTAKFDFFRIAAAPSRVNDWSIY